MLAPFSLVLSMPRAVVPARWQPAPARPRQVVAPQRVAYAADAGRALAFRAGDTNPTTMRTIRQLALALAAIALVAPAAHAQPSSVGSTQAAGNRRIDAGIRIPDARRDMAQHNVQRIDRALERTGRSWERLSRDEQSRLRRAFELLLPDKSLMTYALNDAQARAMVYLAFDDDDRYDRYGRGRGRDDYRDRDDDRPRSCSASVDRTSRDAGWINEAIAPLRRSSNASLSHERELQVLEGVEERARQMAVSTTRCGCPAARDRASDLLDLARSAAARHREGITRAWMTVGDDRLARIQQLAREVEREVLRCS